ncbi:low-density lipoprotein receptor-related protein-like [Haliotis rufescens]|uniref:low-density lipoprotein receptor-related protein-like n=1 Tax=Haliotis rufescens TaxID=6454 RepID=UPI001EB00CBB|nr:low-density lipoprotein receptor-related protein-like [Haliotis rufescens]
MASCCVVSLLCAIFLSTAFVCDGEKPKQEVLEANCNNNINFLGSVVLLVSNLTSVQQCNLIIQSTIANNRLLIDITKLDLVDNCTDTKLDIIDDTGSSIAGPLCEEENATVFRAESNVAQFQYRTSSPNTAGKKLSVIITSFNLGINGTCASIEYQCANKLCIPKDLLCNGYNECSDNSDENDCSGPNGTPPGENVGLIVGLTFACLLVVAVAALCLIRRLRRQQGYDSV